MEKDREWRIMKERKLRGRGRGGEEREARRIEKGERGGGRD